MNGNSVNNVERGPVLIALIPPCGGTRDFIDHLDEEIMTISVAKYFSLYTTVDIQTVLSIWLDADKSDNLTAKFKNTNEKSRTDSKDRKAIHNAVVALRNTEISYLMLFFQKYITVEYFEIAIRRILALQNNHADYLINAAKSIFYSVSNLKVTDTIDILLKDNLNAAQAFVKKEAKEALFTKNNIICCSCMNADLEFLKSILKYSWTSQRVVRFIRWGIEIPRVSFEDLVRYNVHQLFTTGRYYNLQDLDNSYKSWEEFYSAASKKMNKSADELNHADLAAFLGSEMANNGTVHPLNQGSKLADHVNRPSRWSAWTNTSQLTRLPPAIDGQTNSSFEEKLTKRIAFLESKLTKSKSEEEMERKAADAQTKLAETRELELNALNRRKTTATADTERLRSELAALEEQNLAMRTSISQAETLSQLILRTENEIAAEREETAQLAKDLLELETQNSIKVQELIDLKLTVCDLSDQLDRKKKTLRLNGYNGLNTNGIEIKVVDGGSNLKKPLSRNGSSAVSPKRTPARSAPDSPGTLDGSRNSKRSSNSSNTNSDRLLDQPISIIRGLGFPSQVQPSLSPSGIESGRHIAVKFERNPSLAPVECLDY